jgi:hypothetical protein
LDESKCNDLRRLSEVCFFFFSFDEIPLSGLPELPGNPNRANQFLSRKKAMTLTYKLSANDFLTYQLYTASQSGRVQKQRTRNKWVIALIFWVLGFILLYQRSFVEGSLALAVSVAWYFLAPIWERRRYINHYRAYISSTYGERLGAPTSLKIERDELFAKDEGSETKVMTGEIEEITELPSLILMKLKTGASFIIPKKEIDAAALIAHLENMASEWRINYTVKTDWAWK